jgi:hypothetical protein
MALDLEQAAELSVARGVGFAALAIVLTVVGLAAYPGIALRTGALLTCLLWAILRIKALRAPRSPYRSTEVWLMIEPRPAWPPELAQRLVARARQSTLERYARLALAAGLGLGLASLLLDLASLF